MEDYYPKGFDPLGAFLNALFWGRLVPLVIISLIATAIWLIFRGRIRRPWRLGWALVAIVGSAWISGIAWLVWYLYELYHPPVG